MLLIRSPLNSLPIGTHVFPPSVVRRAPIAGPPLPPLLKLPVPAKRVLLVPSKGLNAMAPIESDGHWSVCGLQVGLAAVPLVVFQIPPATLPT
jgi:hypothetical protein